MPKSCAQRKGMILLLIFLNEYCTFSFPLPLMQNGKISFEEFVCGLAILLHGSFSDKCKILFQVILLQYNCKCSVLIDHTHSFPDYVTSGWQITKGGNTVKNEVLTQHFLGCVYACLNRTLQGCFAARLLHTMAKGKKYSEDSPDTE